MGYSYEESEDLALLRETVAKFARSEILPVAKELDETESFSMPLTKKMGELGLMGTIVGQDYGGQGMDYISYIVCVEELARIDGSQAATIAAHNSLGAGPLYYYGTEEQKKSICQIFAAERVYGLLVLRKLALVVMPRRVKQLLGLIVRQMNGL